MSRPESRARAVALAAALAAGGCREPVTEIVVRIDSDMTAGTEVETARVVVSREGSPEATHDVTYDLRARRLTFPGTVGVVTRDPDDPRAVRVEVTPMRDGRALFVHRAAAAPRPREVARLDVFLARRCVDPAAQACPPDATCGATGCVPVARATAAFPGGGE